MKASRDLFSVNVFRYARPSAPSGYPQGLVSLALVLSVLISSCAPERAAPRDHRSRTLIEREIGGGEVQTLRLSLPAGRFLLLKMYHPGTDLEARLVAPDGKTGSFPPDPRSFEEPDRLAWVTEKSGEHRLVVTFPAARSVRGRYRICLQELRHSEARDALRVGAERTYAQARRVLVEKESKETRHRSLSFFEEALQNWKRAEDVPGQVDALVQIAEVYNALGIGKDALEPGRLGLQLARKVRYREGEGRALQVLGSTKFRLGAWGEALALWEGARAIWEEQKDLDRQGIVLRSMGVVANRQSQGEQAYKYFQKAIPLLRSAGDVSGEASALADLANVQLALGDSTGAQKSLEDALALGKKADDPAAQALALFNLGDFYKRSGELDAALRSFSSSLEINTHLGARDTQGYVRQALGSVYLNLGDAKKALEEYSKGLQLSREFKDADLEARLLSNTGWTYQSLGDLRTALQYYGQALALNKERKDPLSVTDFALNNRGVAYVKLGRPEEGLQDLQQALEMKIQKRARASQAGTLLEIGTAYQQLGKTALAEDHYRQALDLARKTGSAGLESECLFRWATLDRGRGRLGDALSRIQESLKIVESVRSHVTSDKLRTSFFASKRDYYEFYVELLMQMEEAHPGTRRAEALEASERAHARGLLDLLAQGKIDVRRNIDPLLKKKEEEFGARLVWLQDRLGRQDPTDKKRLIALQEQLDETQDALQQLESDVRSRYQTYADVRYPKPLRQEQIEALLDDHTALLQYFVAGERSFLFVVTRTGLKSYLLPARSELVREVERLRDILQKRNRRTLGSYQEQAHKLYSQLLGPAEADLRRTTSLLIVPDGALYLLPFEALLTERRPPDRSYGDLSYLVRRYAVSYIPSASILAGLRDSHAQPDGGTKGSKDFIGFGNPTYAATAESASQQTRGSSGAAGGRGLAQLPESEREIQRIASLYPKDSVALYLGDRATEENVKGNHLFETARRIDFATHATLNEERPELSGLELTQHPGSRENGVLQVYEIFNLRLNADLLTLSACETALGKEVTGEGVIGLTRAFLYAGAKSLVVSFWPVSDHSTPELMFRFYKNLGTSPKAEALRQAKLAMIRSKEFSEPYYWAPFVLTGDPC